MEIPPVNKNEVFVDHVRKRDVRPVRILLALTALSQQPQNGPTL